MIKGEIKNSRHKEKTENVIRQKICKNYIMKLLNGTFIFESIGSNSLEIFLTNTNTMNHHKPYPYILKNQNKAIEETKKATAPINAIYLTVFIKRKNTIKLINITAPIPPYKIMLVISYEKFLSI